MDDACCLLEVYDLSDDQDLNVALQAGTRNLPVTR